MSEVEKMPFQSFAFTLVENRQPRKALRLAASREGMFALSVTTGSAANPLTRFERDVPRTVADELHAKLARIGVFGWDEAYGDARAPGMLRWSVRTVFEEGVFSMESRGGSDAPAGFDALLEELYRLDLPRPAASAAAGAAMPSGFGRRGPMSAGDLGAYASAGADGVDFSQLANLFGTSGPDGLGGAGGAELESLLAETTRNPEIARRRMREEFSRLPRAEQDRLLDALASTGMASRAWWERFLRG